MNLDFLNQSHASKSLESHTTHMVNLKTASPQAMSKQFLNKIKLASKLRVIKVSPKSDMSII